MTTIQEEQLAAATRVALEEWESLGAPLASNYGESTRASLQAWPANGAFTKEVYRLAVYFTEQAKMAAQNDARIVAIRVRHQAASKLRETMTDEMREIREGLGLSQSEMDDYLDLKPGMANNMEKPNGSYAVERVEALLRRYRAAAKVRGTQSS